MVALQFVAVGGLTVKVLVAVHLSRAGSSADGGGRSARPRSGSALIEPVAVEVVDQCGLLSEHLVAVIGR
ncbi:hypothetical protein GCM10018781_56490 [Kitasatospora indigofera]|uniref:Uncharacterized protein n=1 Tax=Kitasatospora indigofera TaxID=67307 RepID=A0A919G8B9_9ACTN|nr:hypothetical protein GCM10018781_56490 [Kitasatospora indigofera]